MLNDIENILNLLELKCRQPVEHLLAGAYRSVFRGRGIEFEDVRVYEPGDDVRAMDWRVTARTGEAHVKRFVEEREQFFYLLVDVSASMLHDESGIKRKTVSELCALLTLSAIKNSDRVGLILFTDRIEQVVPPGKGRSHAMRIMHELMNFQPAGTQTDFTAVLGRFGQMAKKHSVAFLVSDFLTDACILDLQALAVKHDVNAIHVAEPAVETGGASGLIRMEDSESGEQRVIQIHKRDTASTEHGRQLQHIMMESGINLLNMAPGDDCVEALAGFFHARQRQEIDETGG